MTNTTQTTWQAKDLSIFLFLMLLLCLVIGWPIYLSPNESWFVIGTFVTAPAIIGGLLVWQLVQWIRSRKQAGADKTENACQG